MRMPIINCFDYQKNYDFYKSFTSTEPLESYRIMDKIRQLDFIRLTEELKGTDDDFELIRNKTLRLMNRFPKLNDNKIQSSKFSDYITKLQFEFTFLLTWANNKKKLDEIIKFENKNVLDNLKKYSSAPIFLPMHVGPSYFIPVMLAYDFKILTMFNKMNLEQLRSLCFPNIKENIIGVNVDENQKIKHIIKSLKNGISLTMFPEYNPNGQGNHTKNVNFFGKKINVPLGPAILSKLSNSPMVPVFIHSNGNGTFNIKFYDLIKPCIDDESVANSIDKIWEILEKELVTYDYGEWEIWYDIEKLLK